MQYKTKEQLPSPIPFRRPQIVHRGLQKRDAQTLAKSLTKKLKSRHEAVACGRLWDVIKVGY